MISLWIIVSIVYIKLIFWFWILLLIIHETVYCEKYYIWKLIITFYNLNYFLCFKNILQKLELSITQPFNGFSDHWRRKLHKGQLTGTGLLPVFVVFLESTGILMSHCKFNVSVSPVNFEAVDAIESWLTDHHGNILQ